MKIVLCIVILEICDGLFGIGGPLMVIDFLSIIHSKDEYLETIHSFFLINVLYSTVFRIIKLIITVDLLTGIGLGMIGILISLKNLHIY